MRIECFIGECGMQLELGRHYTRAEIHDLLGGSIQSFLPIKEGRVVCGCFVRGPAMNPNAPEEVLFGTAGESPDINRAADLAFEQGQRGDAIPVFLKIHSGEWKYVGEYLCIGITRDARVVQRKMQEWPERGQFHGVLRFERV
jgi:hypothetical protein